MRLTMMRTWMTMVMTMEINPTTTLTWERLEMVFMLTRKVEPLEKKL